MEENKVIKQTGLSNSDLEPQDQPKPEAPKSNVIERPKVDMPQHERKNGKITVTEGWHAGNNYDNETDFMQTDGKDDEEHINWVIENAKTFKGADPNKFNREWYDKLPQNMKNIFHDMWKKKKADDIMNQELSKPEVIHELVSDWKKNMPEIYQQQSDEVIWGMLSPEAKRNLYSKKGGKK
jgi:hypothetical protein